MNKKEERVRTYARQEKEVVEEREKKSDNRK